MPRKARIDLCGVASAKTYAPGALHHITIRGIERQAIFRNTADREDFLKRFGHILPDTKTHCYAWGLMTHHVHLLLKTALAPIAMVMRSRRWRD